MKSEKMGIETRRQKLEELFKDTKETVATDVRQEDLNRSFGSIDMWNRQRRQRTSLQMRRWLN